MPMSMFSNVLICSFCERAKEEIVYISKASVCKECAQNIVATFARRMNTDEFHYKEKPSIFR